MATATLLPSISSSSSLPFPPNPQPHSKKRSRPPPISISTNPDHADPLRLRDLLAACHHSCHRFPRRRPDPADPDKLRAALAHSAVVVSAFCRADFLSGDALGFGLDELLERVLPPPPPADSDRRLVGFGRAVSDGGLTASIHDVVVIPPLQRLGIGRKIVQRIIRVLTSKGIYDISALCSERERLFFKACGFGEDSLGSTTMMYTRTAPSSLQDDQRVRPCGRMLLLVPSLQEPLSRIAIKSDDLNEAGKEEAH